MVQLTLRRTWTAAAKYAFAACALCAMATPASAAGDDEALINYFSARLNGSEEAFSQNIPVELSQIEAQQQAVWQAWAKANEAFDEERLIPLDELSLKKNSSWTLPKNLESNAVMNYYYGKKGERSATISKMVHRFTSFLKFPIPEITIAGGKRVSNGLGKNSCANFI